MTECRFHADAATHAFGGAFDDGQADAGAGKFFGRVETLKDPEDLRLILWGYADAVVFNPKPNKARSGAGRAD